MVHGHPRENPTEDPEKPRQAQRSQPRPTKMPSKAHPEMAGDGGPGVEARPPTRQSSKQQKPKTRTPTGQQDANSSGQQPKPRKSRKKRPTPVADPPPSTGCPPPVIRNCHTFLSKCAISLYAFKVTMGQWAHRVFMLQKRRGLDLQVLGFLASAPLKKPVVDASTRKRYQQPPYLSPVALPGSDAQLSFQQLQVPP